eukprot:8728896-Pyramimonas_sp.AAC.1
MASGQVFAASGTMGQGVAPIESGAISGHALPQQPWPKREVDKSGGGKGDKMSGAGGKGANDSKKGVNTDKLKGSYPAKFEGACNWRQKQRHKEKDCWHKAAGKPRAPSSAPPTAAAVQRVPAGAGGQRAVGAAAAGPDGDEVGWVFGVRSS